MLWIPFALAATIPFFPILVRIPCSQRATRRMATAAASIYEQARLRHREEDDELIRIHNAVLGVAIIAPLAACDLVKPVPSSKREIEKLSKYLSENAWLLPYVAAAYFTVSLLLWLGKPYSPRRLKDAAFASIALTFCMRSDGGVEFGPVDPDQSAKRFDSTDLRRNDKRLAVA